MKFSPLKVIHGMGRGPAFYYPEVGGEYFMLSWKEMNDFWGEHVDVDFVEALDYGSVLFSQTGVSTPAENQATLNQAIEMVEDAISECLQHDGKEFRERYGDIDPDRVERSLSDSGDWVAARFEIWSLNLPEDKEIEIKIGHHKKSRKTVVKYTEPPDSLIDRMARALFGKGFDTVSADRSSVTFLENGKIECGRKTFDFGPDYLQVSNGPVILTSINLSKGTVGGTDSELAQSWMEFAD
jgi:hypothetical protein